MRLVASLPITFIGAAAAACSFGGTDPIQETGTAQAALCDVGFELEPRLSLLVTEPQDDDVDDQLTAAEKKRLGKVWAAVEPRFGFGRVISRIRQSSGATQPNTDLKLFRRWMDSYNADPGAFTRVRHCDDSGVDPEGFGFECPRIEGELAGDSFDPFTGRNLVIEPIAIVNRFDLAPTSGENCGEHRIIFAMQSSTSPVSRLFYIFEGALPNPTPEVGLAGCAPVVDLWHGLSDPALTPTEVADRLEQLFFVGLDGFEPVVAASHYGLNGAGQVRTNQLSTTWTLREFKTALACGADGCALSFDEVTTKTNPADEVFDSTDPRSAAFLDDFLTNVKPGGALGAKTAATLSMKVSDAFNTWESNTGETDYAAAADATFEAAVAAQLSAKGMAALSPQNILDRARTQSCMGCHQESSGQTLGGGLVWPASAGFVHVTENGFRSEALFKSFLPRRKTVLSKFIQEQCAGGQTEDDGLTLGGSPRGAPN